MNPPPAEWPIMSRKALSGVFLLFFGILLLLGLPEWPIHKFVLDDWLHISLYKQHAWWEITAYSWTHVLPTSSYRPLFVTVFSGLVKLSRYDPVALRLFLILIHAANIALIFQWLLRLGVHRRAAWMASLLWLLHPVHLEALHWGVAADTQMGLFFILISWNTWMSFLESRRGWEASVLFYALALGSIESSMFLLPVHWLLARYSNKSPATRKPLGIMAGIAVAVIVLRYALRSVSFVNPNHGYALVLGDNVLHNVRQALHQLLTFWPSAHVQWFSGLPFVGGQARILAPVRTFGMAGGAVLAITILVFLFGALLADGGKEPTRARLGRLELAALAGPAAFLPFLLLSNQVSIGNRYFCIAGPGLALMAACLLEMALRHRAVRMSAMALAATLSADMAWHHLCSERLNWRPAMLAQKQLEAQAIKELSVHANRTACINLTGFPRTFGEALAVYPEWGWQGFLQSRIPGSQRWTGLLDATPEQLEAFVASHPLDPLVTLVWKGTDAP